MLSSISRQIRYDEFTLASHHHIVIIRRCLVVSISLVISTSSTSPHQSSCRVRFSRRRPAEQGIPMADLLVAGDWAATMASSKHCGSNVHRRHGPFLSHLGIPPSANMTGSLSHWLRAEVAVGPQNPQPSLDCPHPPQDPLGPVPTLEQPPDPSHIQRDLTDTHTNVPRAHYISLASSTGPTGTRDGDGTGTCKAAQAQVKERHAGQKTEGAEVT